MVDRSQIVMADHTKWDKIRWFGDEIVIYWKSGEPSRHKRVDWNDFYEANRDQGNRYQGTDSFVQSALKGEQKVSPADLLYEYASLEWRIRPFRDTHGLEHIQKFNSDGYYEVVSLDDDRLMSELAILYKNKFGEIIPDGNIKNVIRTLKGQAQYGESIRLFNRAGEHDGILYYDLHNKLNESVRLDLDGWSVVPAPLMFRNHGDGREQVKPIKGEPGQLDKYIDLLKVPERHRNIIKITTICAFQPIIENPIVTLAGESGAGKSKQMDMDRSLIDPQPGDLPGLHKSDNVDDVKLFMSKYYWYGFDNVKGVPDWFGDFINTVTGGTRAERRELYTTANIRHYDIKCIVRMNGITTDLVQSDSLKRSIIVDREVMEGDASTPKELFSRLDAMKPALLGEIFTILCKSMALLKSKNGQYQIPKDISSRLVEFYQLGSAVCEVLDIPDWPGTFRSYIKAQDALAVDENPIGLAIRELMRGRKAWIGTASDLYTILKDIAGGKEARSVYSSSDGGYVKVEEGDPGLGINVKDRAAFPQGPAWMVRAYLKPIVGNLRDENIFATLDKQYHEVKDMRISNDRKAVDDAPGCVPSKLRYDDKVILLTTVKPFKILPLV